MRLHPAISRKPSESSAATGSSRANRLLRTDAAKKRFDKSYLTDHPGMTKEGVPPCSIAA
jgi:hypothetical protein